MRTIESHAKYMNVPRDTPMKKAIFRATSRRLHRGLRQGAAVQAIEDLPVLFGAQRLKDKAFARAVSSDDVRTAPLLPRPPRSTCPSRWKP